MKKRHDLCNGKDDDCDGLVDEDALTPTSPQKPGHECIIERKHLNCTIRGVKYCIKGTVFCRPPQFMGKDLCDGKDNDCDGQIDEDSQLQTNQPCPILRGNIHCQGRTKCMGGLVQCKPTTEICDGQDNDCNGKIDDNLTWLPRPCVYRHQGKSCNKGIQHCRDGNIVCDPPQQDRCDGKDDDCDGQTDEDYPRLGQPCIATYKQCKWKGVYQCRPDKSGDFCQPYHKELIDSCDGKDNDCDGQVDEDAKQAARDCQMPGLRPPCIGHQQCQQGSYVCIKKKEVCNGKDDDCDGQVDENMTERRCYGAPANTEGKSHCRAGKQRCQRGKWGPCVGVQLPRKEICNGKDDDCDGQIDETSDERFTIKKHFSYQGLPCILRLGDPCINGKAEGLCRAGIFTCTKGKIACTSQHKPRAEICNREDDDCDGQVDNTNRTEICNGKDDDCDRDIDNFPGRPCQGADKKHWAFCVKGKWTCTKAVSKPERCNGVDDDLDGQIDEGCGWQPYHELIREQKFSKETITLDPHRFFVLPHGRHIGARNGWSGAFDTVLRKPFSAHRIGLYDRAHTVSRGPNMWIAFHQHSPKRPGYPKELNKIYISHTAQFTHDNPQSFRLQLSWKPRKMQAMGSYLLLVDQYNFQIWDVDTRLFLNTPTPAKSPIQYIQLRPQHRHLLYCTHEQCFLWDIANTRQLRSFPLPTKHGKGHQLVLSPNGHFALFVYTAYLHIVDLRTGKVVLGRTRKQSAASWSFHPTQPIFAFTELNNSVERWDLATGRQLTNIGQTIRPVRLVRFHPQGQILLTVVDNYLLLQDWTQSKILQVLKLPNPSTIEDIQFFGHGHYFFIAWQNHTYKVYKRKVTLCPTPLLLHEGRCHDITSDPEFCGLARRKCLKNMPCLQGKCSCHQGETYCHGGQYCADLQRERFNCGSCGNTCRGRAQGCGYGYCIGEVHCDPREIEYDELGFATCVGLPTHEQYCKKFWPRFDGTYTKVTH